MPALASRFAALVLVCSVAVGCGEDLSITSPGAGSTLRATEDGTVPVEFSVRGDYQLEPKGACGEQDKCGHVVLELLALNEDESLPHEHCPGPTGRWNVEGATEGPIHADLRRCSRQKGRFQITLGLRDDDGYPIDEGLNPTVRFTVIE